MAFSLDANKDILNAMQQAIEEGKDDEAGKLFVEFAQGIEQSVLTEARKEMALMRHDQDTNILSARGNRQLTSEEREYYEAVIQASKASDPKQAITNIDRAFPRTIIDEVMNEIESDHPLLDMVDFQNTTGVTEWIINRGTRQLAAWGKLCAEIVKELEGDIDVVSMVMHKLSAWIPICKAMLELGPEWVDRYVRAILKEALLYGLEAGIVTGTGVDMPIGMDRDLEAAKADGDPYVQKTPIAVTKFDPATYGALLGGLAVDRNGRGRKVTGVFMVVNPVDYFTKVMPATTYFLPGAGIYTDNVFPYPTTVIQSEEVAIGRAILGLKNRYFMGSGIEKDGKIEYSDEYKFLEDERTYKIRFLGNGFPKDNTSFQVLDISGLKPFALPVEIVEGAVPTP